jgi:hypothetical protein
MNMRRMHLKIQRQIDRVIVTGYTLQPPTEAETTAAVASLRAAILDEPW